MSTLNDKIEDLELDEMTPKEIQRTVKALSPEGMAMRRSRKNVRYKLYRLATESLGGPASGVDDDFKESFEKHSHFGGWRFFGVTWDITADEPYECVHRAKSSIQEWDELVASKFPQIEPGGKVTYPDINVRKKVEKNQKTRKKAK